MNRSAFFSGLFPTAERIALALLFAAPALGTQPPAQAADPQRRPPAPPGPPKLVAYQQEVPVAAYKIDMLPVPGTADGAVKPFYMSKTEITWEAFDVYIYRLDEEAGKGPKNADAVTRPSKPYLPPDRGYGHEGFAAISMSHKNASEFCKWLSEQTGKTYRLPTEAEWEQAAKATGTGDKATGTAVPEGSTLPDCAWLASNSDASPQKVGTKKPNALGLCDMLGNVAEWVTDRDGKPVVKGGSFRDDASKLTVAARTPADPAWNRSDPQVPKSKWWLADAPFIGFRIVCEVPPPAPAHEKPVVADPKSPTPTPASPSEPTSTPEKKP
jgi:hypothetical protein